MSGFVPLIEFLLDNGADPALKAGIAVKVAIQKRDLGLVRMLVERRYEPPPTSTSTKITSFSSRRSRLGRKNEVAEAGMGKGGENVASGGAKRRRMEDRMKVTPALLQTAVRHGAMDIVDWMMREKGCVPDMKTISMMMVMES